MIKGKFVIDPFAFAQRFFETGLLIRLQRKSAKCSGRGLASPFLQSRSLGKSRTIRAISEDCHRDSPDSRCDPDCMAEGEGFEPPVPFPVQWFSSSQEGSEPL
jgi:hypothetical protein